MDPFADDLVVRTLSRQDLPRLVAIDTALTGRRRDGWYEEALRRAEQPGTISLSVGVEEDGTLVGAMLGAVRYGAFGQPEPVAVIDTIIVDPGHHGHGVGRALMDQLVRNLRALRVEKLRTEVDWADGALLGFLNRYGFTPIPRLVLEYAVE